MSKYYNVDMCIPVEIISKSTEATDGATLITFRLVGYMGTSSVFFQQDPSEDDLQGAIRCYIRAKIGGAK